MDDRYTLIQLLKFIENINYCDGDIRFFKVVYNYDFKKVCFDFIQVLQKILNRDIILLDSNRIKEDIINNKILLNNIKLAIGDEHIDTIEKYKYNISWNLIKLNEFNNYLNDNEKEKIIKYLDDSASQEFVDFLNKKYGILKEE